MKLKIYNHDGSLKEETDVTRIEPDPRRVNWYICYVASGGVVYLTRDMLNKFYGNEWWALVKQGSRGATMRRKPKEVEESAAQLVQGDSLAEDVLSGKMTVEQAALKLVSRVIKGALGYAGGPAIPLDVVMHELYIRSADTLRRKPELSNRRIAQMPDTSLEWIGKYEFEVGEDWDPPLATGEEELVIIGKVGEKFDTPERVDALKRYRYQKAVGNHLLFRTLLPWEVLDQLAELAGYNKRRRPLQVGDQKTMAAFE